MENRNNVSEYMCPQSEAEFMETINRVVSNRFFKLFSRAVWGDTSLDKTRGLMLSLHDVDDFQRRVMFPFITNVLHMSSDGFTFSGEENIEAGKSYLFVSNHRDIVVDPLLLQYVLMKLEMKTTDITIGNNLLNVGFLVDLARMNKIFRVVRDSKSIKDYMANSMMLSEFLRGDVKRGRSVWIAQRNGRAKDGNDATARGLVKMFGVSSPDKEFVSAYAELNVVPVSISYEIESCDFLKAAELYKTRDGEPYVKSRHEDMKSILTGVMQPKGRIHLTMGRPLTQEVLSALGQTTKNEFQNNLTDLIDRRIFEGYRLFPNNYIAHDMRSGSKRFADKYNGQDFASFQKRVATLKELSAGLDFDAMLGIFLGIYANPVDNVLAALGN